METVAMAEQQQSFSPPRTRPPMTYDEASMEGSRHFYTALQELKSLQPQLYSAAEYCESSYLFNDQKQVVLENLKDYAVKALVNAVDHLGTVAYKLDEVLSQQISEISSVEIRVSGLTQRVRTCQEHKSFEVLSHQRPPRTNRRYHKHYLLPDDNSKTREESKENVEGKINNSEISSPHHVTEDAGKTLSWHLATEPPVAINATKDGSTIRALSLSSGSESPTSDDISLFPADPPGHTGQASPLDILKPIVLHPSFDEKSSGSPKLAQHTPSRSKSLLSSLLGRRRSGKS